MARMRGQAGGIGRRRLMGMTLATGFGVSGSLLPGLERLSVGLLHAAGSGAVERLEAAAAAYLAAEQALTAVEGSWAIARRTLGLSLVIAPAEGSHGPLGLGQPPAVLTAEVDSAALAATLATLPALDRPPVEARLLLDGATVTVSPEAPGRRLDLTALADVLEERARLLDDSPVALPLVEQPATTTAAALAPVADWLRRVLARPLLLTGTPGPAAIPPGAIAAALRVEPTGSVRPDPAAWERLLASMAGSVAVAPTEPVLILAPERAEIVPARLGQVLDVPATAAVAWLALRASQAEVWPVFRPVAPARSADDLAPVAALASRLLAQPPVLVAGAVEWPLAPADLARLLRPADQGLDVDSTAAGEVIRAFAARAAVAPQWPLYRWREGRVEADGPGRPGWQLDREAALAVLRDGLLRGEDRLVLPLVEAPPVAPEGLEFPDLLAEGRTYFADSVRERYTNVALGLARINGALVPPGGEFSFNAASGPVTFAAGFKRGYGIAISNGKVTTLPSVGGGICQVATTVFHAAFHAGLPIGQRSWHLYWMPRYGRPPSGLTGLDATVDDESSLDFTFFNTTGQWLLVEAVVEGGYAVVRLRGTAPGWRVAVAGPFISNFVRANPTMTERPEPTLPKGSRVWVEHAEDGKTVAIKRTVHDDLGRLLERRTFTARYAPAANVTLVGTG